MRIIKACLICAVLLHLHLPSLFSDIAVNGSLRTTGVLTRISDTWSSGGIIEGTLRLTAENETWKFRSDIRDILSFGSYTNIAGLSGFSILDILVKFQPSWFAFSLGKIYPAFGILSPLNPFEFRKGLNPTDLKFEREGSAMAMADIGLGQLSGFRIWLSPGPVPDQSGFGLEAFSHLGSFDFGGVCNRKSPENNVTGLFLKGDLILGVNASWALHFRDDGSQLWNEASAGCDYSFFTGKLLLSATAYYAEHGAPDRAGYDPQNSEDRYLFARGYGYFNATYVFDEFFSAQADVFLNACDGSVLVVPSIKSILANGLALLFYIPVPLGQGPDEFSPDRLGLWSAALRLEARM
jgi:hypothetical protein